MIPWTMLLKTGLRDGWSAGKAAASRAMEELRIEAQRDYLRTVQMYLRNRGEYSIADDIARDLYPGLPAESVDGR